MFLQYIFYFRVSFIFRPFYLSVYYSSVFYSGVFSLSPDNSLCEPFSFNVSILFSVLPFSIFFSGVFSQSVYFITSPPFHNIFGILSSASSFVPDTIIGNISRFCAKLSPSAYLFSIPLLSVPTTVDFPPEFVFTPKHIIQPYCFYYIPYFSVQSSSLFPIPITIFLWCIYRESIFTLYFPSSVFLLSRHLLFF